MRTDEKQNKVSSKLRKKFSERFVANKVLC